MVWLNKRIQEAEAEDVVGVLLPEARAVAEDHVAAGQRLEDVARANDDPGVEGTRRIPARGRVNHHPGAVRGGSTEEQAVRAVGVQVPTSIDVSGGADELLFDVEEQPLAGGGDVEIEIPVDDGGVDGRHDGGRRGNSQRHPDGWVLHFLFLSLGPG